MTKPSRNSAGSLHKKISAPVESRTTIASDPKSWRCAAIILLSLLALTFVSFLPVLRCDFINYDDGKIIAANPQIRNGLTLPGLFWAWTTFELGYPQPVALTSFMLDADLFGIDHPGAFHATNLAIHCANVLLLYLLLASATGSRYRSALVAAIFAVHPLQVESVAWVAERKGLLATFFALLAMIAYLRHAHAQGRWSRLITYAMTLVLLALSLLSKPIFVVFPVLLLLADVWPLRRLVFSKSLPLAISQIERSSPRELASKKAKSNPRFISPVSVSRLLLEKLPYVILVALVIFLGIRGQRTMGSAVGASTSPFLARLGGAAVVCARSVWKSIACVALALPYPESDRWLAVQIIPSLVLLTAITALAIRQFRRAPWLLIGWLAFLALLAPITGIISFGGHRFADRYSYVPLICLAVMIVWSIPAACFSQGSATASRWRMGAAGAPTGGVHDSAGEGTGGTLFGSRSLRKSIFPAVLSAICTLATLTFLQARHWRNSFTLFAHTLAVTPNNATAHTLLGNAYLQRETPADVPIALDHFEQALGIDPADQPANLDAGIALQKLGRPIQAVAHFRKAIDFNPRTADGQAALQALGDILLDQGKIDEAIAQYHLALQIAPDSARAHCNLGMALGKQGRLREAIAELTVAINENPLLPEAHRYLGTALLMQGRPDLANESFRTALSLNGNSPEGWLGLGNACAATHDFDNAIYAYHRALDLRSDYDAARSALKQAQSFQDRSKGQNK